MKAEVLILFLHLINRFFSRFTLEFILKKKYKESNVLIVFVKSFVLNHFKKKLEKPLFVL